VKVPEEAAIVERIFRMYASGMSLRAIAGILNDEGIPTSRDPRTRRKAAWSMSAIREMLKNTRYIGKTVWGRTLQVRNPETGKMKTRQVSENEWKYKDLPELRIISDELWTQVQEQFARATRGFGVKRLGGMSRTEASRKYLFSGLLRCGLCGGKMNITTTNPPRYGCTNRREQKTCPNKATIPLELLERQFVSVLSEKLQSEDLREELIQALLENLQDGKNKRLAAQDATIQERRDLEQARETLTIQIRNLACAIRECGSSRALLAELTEAEAADERINTRLASVSEPPSRDITEEEIRAFLNQNASSIKEILLGTPETVKHNFQKRITSIILTPTSDERGPVYRVSGDIGLLSSPEDVLQSNQVELIALQYTIPISFDVVPYRNHQKWAA
jgi:hypothetical protein